MASLAERLCQAVVDALNESTGAVALYRDRSDAFHRDESPALLVECLDETTTPLGGPAGPWRPVGQAERNELSLAVTVVVRDAQWQRVADDIRCQAHRRVLQLLRPPGLSNGAAPGVAQVRRQRCEWRAASADVSFGYVSQVYLITYDGQAHDLEEPRLLA
jgi:hypothetical protein